MKHVPSLKTVRTGVHGAVLRALEAAGVHRSDAAIAAAAQRYWGEPHQGRSSHWAGTGRFAQGDLWSRIGLRHLEMVQRAARAIDVASGTGRIVEWGCGGGANAVHLAPTAREFIGVDVSNESLRECARQVAACCDATFRPVLVDVASPEAALPQIEDPCDLFLCFYVFELIPSQAYGERILRIAHRLLSPGGMALIQIKYDTGSWRTKPRRLSYGFSPGNMTTYPIHVFWQLAARCGFEPKYVQLVPEDELDERYAYFVLVKPCDGPTTSIGACT